MRSVSKLAAVIVLLLLGPAMYMVSRAHSLGLAFARIQPGDSAATVINSMGKPQDETSGTAVAGSRTEYRYIAWPFPRAWIISLRDGKVVDKAEVER